MAALKILAPGLAADEEFRRRFTAESRAAAAVDHPHIIPVYEAGQAGGVLFIAMRFVTGGDLRGVLAREGPLPPGRAAGFLSPVASALDAAHRAGLVHRDVKPGNVLVDSDPGRPEHVYLSDFGISKGAAASSAGLTGTGQFLGTPEYTSPEQARGLRVDGRADQYALACVAWHLLAGTVPFQRDQGHAVLLAHLTEPPPSLAGRRPDLPAASGQVLARAMAKEPGDRYPSCGEFTDALRQALALPPYRPAAPGPAAAGHPRTEISGQPAFPEPDAAAVGMAAAPADPAGARVAVEGSFPAAAGGLGNPAGTVSGAGGLAAGLNKPAASADRPTEDLVTAGRRIRSGPGPGDDAAQPARRRRFLAIALACALLTAAAVVPLVLAMPGAPQPLSGPLTGTLTATLTDPASQGVYAMALGPGGTTLADADDNGSTYVWDTATGKITATLTNPVTLGVSGPSMVAFGAGGTTLADADLNGRTYLWDTATGKITATLTNPASQGVEGVAFGPGGATLAAGDGNGRIYLWDTATGKITATLADPASKGVDPVAFGPDGTTLAAGDMNGRIYLWDTATGKITATLADPASQGVRTVAFGPGGTTLAAGDFNGRIYLWDTATGKITATLADPASKGAPSVAFGPGGTTLAAGDGNGRIYLWDTATGKITATLADPASKGAWSVAFGPAGTTLAAGDMNGRTYLWRISRLRGPIDKMLSLPVLHPQAMPTSANRAIISRRSAW